MVMEMGYQIFQRLAAEADEARALSPWGAVTSRTARHAIKHDRFCRGRCCKPPLEAEQTPASHRARQRRIVIALVLFELALAAILLAVAVRINA